MKKFLLLSLTLLGSVCANRIDTVSLDQVHDHSRTSWNRTQLETVVRTLSEEGRTCLSTVADKTVSIHDVIDNWEMDQPAHPRRSSAEILATDFDDFQTKVETASTRAKALRRSFMAAKINETSQKLGIPKSFLTRVPEQLRNCSTEFIDLRNIVTQVIESFQQIPESCNEDADCMTDDVDNTRSTIVERVENTYKLQHDERTSGGVCEWKDRVGDLLTKTQKKVVALLKIIRRPICGKIAALARSDALRQLIACVANERIPEVQEGLRREVLTKVNGMLRTFARKCAASVDGRLERLRLKFKRRIRMKALRRIENNEDLTDEDIENLRIAIFNKLRERIANITSTDVEIAASTGRRRLEEQNLDLVVSSSTATSADLLGTVEDVFQEQELVADTEEVPGEVDDFSIATDEEYAEQASAEVDISDIPEEDGGYQNSLFFGSLLALALSI